MDTETPRAPLRRLSPIRKSRGGCEKPGKQDLPGEVTLYLVNDYAVRPFSAAGLPNEDGAGQPFLSAGIHVRLANDAGVATDTGWTDEELQKAVLGPEGKGPVRFLDFLDPPARPEWDLVGKAGVAAAAGTRHALLEWLVRDPAGFAAAVDAHPLRRDGDLVALINAVAAHAPPDDLPLVRQISVKGPAQREALFAGLSRNSFEVFAGYLHELAKSPEGLAAVPYLARANYVYTAGIAKDAKIDYLDWLQTQPEPQPSLAEFAQEPAPSQVRRWSAWLGTAKDAPTRGLLLANLAPLLQPQIFSFGERVRLAFQYSDYVEYFGSGRSSGRSYREADWAKWNEIQAEALKVLLKASADPALLSQAIAALAISDQAEAYRALAAILNDPQNASLPFDPAYVILLGTSVVSGDRPEMGREMLRGWLRKPAVHAAHPTQEENQTFALAVDLLRREYILTDDDLPAIVDRYTQEMADDLASPRMHLSTHSAFAEAFFINPELTLDRVAALLDSPDGLKRDSGLAIFTTQTRVDALNGARPETLPELENLPLRLEGVTEEQKKAQVAAWKQWLKLRRGDVLKQMRMHLE